MKILSNNKGISLVVLIVVMTLIGVLGTSFVSLMGSKQKGFLYQIDSYRALNIANAGLEYAIRYVSDGLSDTNNPGNTFFNNPSASVTRTFGGGTFAFTYDNTNNRIVVIGNYPDPNPLSRREIRLSNFRRYLSPVSLRPDGLLTSRPQISGSDMIIPVTSNNESSFTVNYINVTIPAPGADTYVNILREGTSVFNYSASAYVDCGATPVSVCKSTTDGIYIGSGGGSFRFDLSTPVHGIDSLYIYTLRFSLLPVPTGQYAMDFYTSLPSGNPFTIRFLP